MKSLALHIQSALESLSDCLSEVHQASEQVTTLERDDLDPPISSDMMDRVVACCLKAERELQHLSAKVR